MHIVRGRAAVDRPTRRRGKTFTGEVWADPLLSGTPEGHTVGSVTFVPGARTYWHDHTSGQLLVVTAGMGWVCAEGAPPAVVRAGDVVWTPPGERHWHGATRNTILTHLALSLGPTNWGDEVADSDYPTDG